jgi:hypothetical protein
LVLRTLGAFLRWSELGIDEALHDTETSSGQ